jgi:hypothetical protein
MLAGGVGPKERRTMAPA